MRNCCLAVEDYLDGDLSKEESEAWLGAACTNCLAIVEQQRQVDDLLRATWEQVGSPHIGGSPNAVTSQETSRERLSHNGVLTGRRLVSVLVVASLVSAASLVFVLFEGEHSPTVVRDPNKDLVSVPETRSPDEPEPIASEPFAQPPKTAVSSSRGLVVPVVEDSRYTIVRYVTAVDFTDHYPSEDTSTFNQELTQ